MLEPHASRMTSSPAQHRKVQAWKIIQAPGSNGAYTRTRVIDTLYTEAEANVRLQFLKRGGYLGLSIKTALVRELL